ncbi:MAG: hypothetical protein KIS97_11450 [Nitrospira sp.]|nr:hypothetical protein [Nitrospira sp.]HNK49018.1 hypothetical protein [Nitrospira sp.]
MPKLLDWFNNRETERLFLLTGGPGSGKSMVMAWLAGHGPIPVDGTAQQQLAEIRAEVKACHFCVADSGNTDPKEVARQIADQLTRTVPGFGEALAATLPDQVRINSVLKDVTVQQGGSVTGVYIGYFNLQGLSEELSFNRVLRDPLQQLYRRDGYDEPMLLLFDALDEALTYSGKTHIVHLLQKFSDLPPNVRILATTRDVPQVTNEVKKWRRPYFLMRRSTLLHSLRNAHSTLRAVIGCSGPSLSGQMTKMVLGCSSSPVVQEQERLRSLPE